MKFLEKYMGKFIVTLILSGGILCGIAGCAENSDTDESSMYYYRIEATRYADTAWGQTKSKSPVAIRIEESEWVYVITEDKILDDGNERIITIRFKTAKED